MTLPTKHPEKVKELRKLFIAEAKKYQVFPMDASVANESGHAAPQHHCRPLRVRLHPAHGRNCRRVTRRPC